MSRSTLGTFAILFMLFCYLVTQSCKRGPETQDPFSLEVRSSVVEEFEDIRWAEHQVIVREVMQSSKYIYAKVKEGSETYWIATGPGSIKPGATYVFNEAVVKKDFLSAELDREFDSIYLVTQLVPADRKEDLKRLRFNPHANAAETETDDSHDGKETEQVQKVTLNELLKEPKRFENQQLEISGICIKVNANILDRNWIHLKSHRDDAQEVVATSSHLPLVGESITLQAIVRLDKDFGAGYIYPVLLEDAILIE